MRIAVCLKAVPGSAYDVGIAPGGQGLHFRNSGLAVGESDDCALEAALDLKRRVGGQVLAITVGGQAAQEILYVALAKGADRAARIDLDAWSPDAVAHVLATYLSQDPCDLILTGAESEDRMTGQVGVDLAARLNRPWAYAVTGVAPAAPGQIVVTKEVGGGALEVWDMPLPALLCVQAGICPRTMAPVARVIQARRKPVDLWRPAAAAPSTTGVGWQFTAVGRPQTRGRRLELLGGDVAQVARQILDLLPEVP